LRTGLLQVDEGVTQRLHLHLQQQCSTTVQQHRV
jgi:hypothetical protein